MVDSSGKEFRRLKGSGRVYEQPCQQCGNDFFRERGTLKNIVRKLVEQLLTGVGTPCLNLKLKAWKTSNQNQKGAMILIL
jgi:hypothetical protein